MRLIEAGIIDMWTQNELQKSQIKSRKIHVEKPINEGSDSLTLKHLQGAFFMLGFGVILAAIVLLLEVGFHKLFINV